MAARCRHALFWRGSSESLNTGFSVVMRAVRICFVRYALALLHKEPEEWARNFQNHKSERQESEAS